MTVNTTSGGPAVQNKAARSHTSELTRGRFCFRVSTGGPRWAPQGEPHKFRLAGSRQDKRLERAIPLNAHLWAVWGELAELPPLLSFTRHSIPHKIYSMQRILIHIKSRSFCWMCPSAPRVCSEPGVQKPVLSLSLDRIILKPNRPDPPWQCWSEMYARNMALALSQGPLRSSW